MVLYFIDTFLSTVVSTFNFRDYVRKIAIQIRTVYYLLSQVCFK